MNYRSVFNLIISLVYSFIAYADTHYLIKQLCLSAPISEQQMEYLSTLQQTSNSNIILDKITPNLPLFKRYPTFASILPYINLGNYPTPIYQIKDVHAALYVKDEGVCGKKLENGTQLCGGNKIRKLEFTLADAIRQGCSTVMTFGPVGSNHAAATTMYAQSLGLKSICLLSHQPISKIVQSNLLLQKYYGAELYFYKTREEREQAAFHHFVEYHAQQGKFPYVIPTGASYPLGTVAFVNAVFELQEQIQAGIMSEPDIMYVAGTYGTLAGLILGCKVVGLKTKVIGVAIQPDNHNILKQNALFLVRATNTYLHEHDNSFPLFDWCEDDITIVMDFTGPGYGISTLEAEEAISFLKNKLNIMLDHVYAGKAFAAVLNHINSGFLDNKKILFWNTFSGADVEHIIKTVDYTTLKPEFHCYFEELNKINYDSNNNFFFCS